jgi:hypothetical protein
MFKDSVTYTDFNDESHTEVLWFNITKTDILGKLALVDRAEAIEKNLRGPQRELTTPEKQEILDVVKEFMQLAYGKKSADGRHFRKSPEIWEDFRWSAAYDAYLLSLFMDENKSFVFITSVMPKDLREQAQREGKLRSSSEYGVSVDGQTGEVTSVPSPANVEEKTEDKPAWLLEGRAPTAAEFAVASDAEKFEAFRLKSQS